MPFMGEARVGDRSIGVSCGNILLQFGIVKIILMYLAAVLLFSFCCVALLYIL